ncbi:MAG: sulfite exporter TauE/SafE family protein [Acidimicrobiia bacterium]
MRELEATTAARFAGSVGMAVAIGVFAGMLSGLFGVGGGIMVVPALVSFMSMDQRLAQGTSLVAVAPMGLAGMIGYAVSDSVDWTVALLLLAGSTVGTFVGTKLLRSLPIKILQGSFAALLVLTALRMVFDIEEGAGHLPIDLGIGLGLVGLGLFTGALAGLMGVGGGVIMVPAQNVLFSIPSAVAKGTSLAVIVPTAIVGSIQNVRHRTANLRIGLTVGAAGVLTSFLFSLLAVRLDPTLSAILFAILLVVSAARILMGMRGESQPQAQSGNAPPLA